MTGKELQTIIKNSGKTQKELAAKMGMHSSQWTAYFAQDDVKSGIVEAVAKMLGMTVGQMYGEDKSANPAMLALIESRDRQIDKDQEQIDRLLGIIEQMQK